MKRTEEETAEPSELGGGGAGGRGGPRAKVGAICGAARRSRPGLGVGDRAAVHRDDATGDIASKSNGGEFQGQFDFTIRELARSEKIASIHCLPVVKSRKGGLNEYTTFKPKNRSFILASKDRKTSGELP